MAAAKKPEGEGVLVAALNKSARRDYEIVDVLEAGISLLGSEVKAIRGGGARIQDSYVKVRNGQATLINAHIPPYAHARPDAYDPNRERTLLLHRREILHLDIQSAHKGLTIVPLRLYFKGGRCKLELGVGRGKKKFDKREDVKKREAERSMRRALKGT